MDKTDLFISYGRGDDEPFVRRLYEDLRSRGFRVWWDRVSMPSRGLTFTQEIRDAIDRTDRVLLVVGPHAIASAYVRFEWSYALLFARGVVPVLRIGTYALLPDELRQLHCPDCRESRAYDEGLTELVRVLAEPLPVLGPLRTDVPQLPPHFLSMRAELDALRSTVLPDLERPVPVTEPPRTTLIQGMGGIGKSVLATAFARATKTRHAFPDGVVWLPLGPSAGWAPSARLLASIFGEDPARYAEPAAAKARLPALLEEKRCLIVLDGVWRIDDVWPFRNALGPRCRLLLTSRDASLATALGAQVQTIQLLDTRQALVLLADWAGEPDETLPPEAHDVARECAGLPLALALCGARVRDGLPWTDLRDALRAAELEFLDHPYGSVMRSLKVSVDALSASDAALYAQLVVFARPVSVPEGAVLTLWGHTGGLSERQGRSLLADLRNKALIRLDGKVPHRRVSLHDLQHDYLRRPPNDGLTTLNETLLEAYRRKSPAGWPSGPNDGYFFEHLAQHLVAAGRTAELLRLLCGTPGWMEAKSVALADPLALADDIDVAWDAICPAEGPDRPVTCASLQAVRQLPSALSARGDLEIELLVRLGRSAEAWRSVRGRTDINARFEGLHTIYTATRDSGLTDSEVVEEMEAVARKMPDRGATAAALARLGALLRGSDDERSRALLGESLALATALENPLRQLDVMEHLAPPLRALGDPRVDAVLARIERSARELAPSRELAKALGRLGMILADVGSSTHAEALLNETYQLSVRLSNEGDTTLIADLGLHGVRLPEDQKTGTASDLLDRLLREASALEAGGERRSAEDLLTAEKEIQEISDPQGRDMMQVLLATVLVLAGEIDRALDVASRIVDVSQRLAALQRIVKAMTMKGDARAESLFLRMEETARSQAPDKLARCEALGAVAVALHSIEPALALELLASLSTEARLADESAFEPSIVLGLAGALARIGDSRYQQLFNRVFQRATAHNEGVEMVLGQMDLGSLARALLDCGFVDQARDVIARIHLNDQRMFAMTALTGELAAHGDFATADRLVAYIQYEDLGEAARIRVTAERARRGDPRATAYFDDWSERARDLRQRFDRETALGALARGLVTLGRLQEARQVIDSMAKQQVRDEALVLLARALAEKGRWCEALRALPAQGVDGYVRTVAELAPLLERQAPGQGIAALREVMRIAGWVRPDWKALHKRLARLSMALAEATL